MKWEECVVLDGAVDIRGSGSLIRALSPLESIEVDSNTAERTPLRDGGGALSSGFIIECKLGRPAHIKIACFPLL